VVKLTGVGASAARLEGRGLKGQKRGGVLGKGQPVASPPARGCGERCKIPSGIRDRAPANTRCRSCILKVPGGISWNFSFKRFKLLLTRLFALSLRDSYVND